MNVVPMLAQFLEATDQIWLYALPLIGSVMLAYAVYNLLGDLRKPDSKRVSDRLRENPAILHTSANERTAKKSILRRKEDTGTIGAAVLKLGFAPALQRLLDQADVSWGPTSFLINTVGLSAFGYIGGYFLKVPPWGCLVVALACLFLPLMYVSVKRKRRINKLMNQLPDVFELMSQGLRAGHSLANAILLVSQQLPDPVGKEFAQVFHEQNLGIGIEDALKNMAKRIDQMDVRFFVTAVLIQRQTGGDLAEVLDNISGVIRERIKLFGTVKALTAEGRLSGWVLLALPVVVFLMELVVNPDYANVLLEDPIGQKMLMGAGVAQLMGLALIKKIVNIKV